jgi:hypothetical protein
MNVEFNVEYFGQTSADDAYDTIWHRGPLEHETPLITLICDTPIGDVHGNYELHFQVAIDVAALPNVHVEGPSSFVPIFEKLHEMGEEVRRIVWEAEKILRDGNT